MTDKPEVYRCEIVPAAAPFSEVEDQHGIVRRNDAPKPQQATPAKVHVLTEVDFAWSPQHNAFMPVLGSMHGDIALGLRDRMGRPVERHYVEAKVTIVDKPQSPAAKPPALPKRPSARRLPR